MSISKRYPSAILSFITGPIRTEMDGDRVILTHLQKYSHFWLMLTFTGWVPTFHFGLMWKLQDFFVYDYYGTPTLVWKPGTERGIYFRTPWLSLG